MPVNIIVSLKEHLCRVHEHVNTAFQSNLHLGWGIRLWSHLSSWEMIRIKSVVQFHSCSWHVAFQQHQYKHFPQMPFIGLTGKLEKSLVKKQIQCQWILTSLRLQSCGGSLGPGVGYPESSRGRVSASNNKRSWCSWNGLKLMFGYISILYCISCISPRLDIGHINIHFAIQWGYSNCFSVLMAFYKAARNESLVLLE